MPRLSGSGFAARYDGSTTDDATQRWVATDESGWDGEQLIGRFDRFMTIGSVACDDEHGERVLQSLRRAANLGATGEVKFKHLRRNPGRLEALAETMVSTDLLGNRCMIYVVDKHFMAASKLVDLLIEEHTSSRGINLYAAGANIVMGRALTNEAASELGAEQHLDLLQNVVDFASMRNVGGGQVSVEELMACLYRARAACGAGFVADVLGLALRCETEAHDHLAHLDRLTREDTPAAAAAPMEPLVPSVAALIGCWVERLGPISVLADEQLTLTDEILDVFARLSAMSLNDGRNGWTRGPHSASVHRGSSDDHPSIQLADLVAGAGLAVARGEVDPTRGVPPTLRAAVLGALAPISLLPHDEPGQIVAST
ncbi:hypothetical protein SAMN05192575_105185 [Nocardioides alpinus]|uniref:DUF3800 domain-containing protein n=1 Tax=Nocardioides alpinus TaxID=748909 RepID=A0A1I0ZCD4_9ACTN|nr:hypothetical protein [Nocardioides alpinus]PKH40720.1 hypothetical protein CXG46_12085 [Nocardioides alpinus]SFB22796.1 hypothetical protein SAMN05192575_105185 [Nocardioides alpinus]